ncbi:MAG: hypothetical protein K2G30_03205 [Muribaculaceae bacterium]|nr:hypothetical protein [Muribaculaceae bacterium]
MKSEKRYKARFRLSAAVAAAMVSALLPSCNNQGCTDNHNALPLMGFYTMEADGDGRLSELAIALDSIDIGGVGAPDDSLLVASGQRTGSLYLPFRYHSERTAFFFHYNYKAQGLDRPVFNDTITFAYESEPYFASEECGAMYRYRVRGVEYTRHVIDSVAVTDSVVTNIERERFKVYFRVANPGQGPDNGTLEVPDDPDRLGEIELGKPAALHRKGGRP